MWIIPKDEKSAVNLGHMESLKVQTVPTDPGAAAMIPAGTGSHVLVASAPMYDGNSHSIEAVYRGSEADCQALLVNIITAEEMGHTRFQVEDWLRRRAA